MDVLVEEEVSELWDVGGDYAAGVDDLGGHR